MEQVRRYVNAFVSSDGRVENGNTRSSDAPLILWARTNMFTNSVGIQYTLVYAVLYHERVKL